jgi:S-adenosylmethionine:tRNA-ribosyltransferase-isomerase (queuine synthetase)
MQGFVAIEYGDMFPASVLEASRTAAQARFVTLLATSEGSEAARTSGVHISPELIEARIEHDGRIDLLHWTDDSVTITCESGC